MWPKWDKTDSYQRFQSEIIRELTPRTAYFRFVRGHAGLLIGVVADQGILHPKDGVAILVSISLNEDMGNESLVSFRRDHKMNAGWPPRMPGGSVEHVAYGPIVRDG